MINFLKRAMARHFPVISSAVQAWRTQRALRSSETVRTPDGFLFSGLKLMQTGEFEPAESSIVRRYAGHGAVFVDVGANIGYYVCMARHRGSKVIAVEPMSENLNILYSNLLSNNWGDVEVFPLALGSKPGIVTIHGGGTGASILPRWAGSTVALKRVAPLSTLDILLGTRFDGADILIKVDVEGVEHLVLSGATETLMRTPTPRWLLEVCFSENFPEGVNPHFKEVFTLFWRYGYTAYSIEADLRVVEPQDVERWLQEGRRDFGYVGFLFERGVG